MKEFKGDGGSNFGAVASSRSSGSSERTAGVIEVAELTASSTSSLNAAHALLELHEPLADRPSHFRQSLAEQQHRDGAEDQHHQRVVEKGKQGDIALPRGRVGTAVLRLGLRVRLARRLFNSAGTGIVHGGLHIILDALQGLS